MNNRQWCGLVSCSVFVTIPAEDARVIAGSWVVCRRCRGQSRAQNVCCCSSRDTSNAIRFTVGSFWRKLFCLSSTQLARASLRYGELQLGYTRHLGRVNSTEVNLAASSLPFDFSGRAGIRNWPAASLPRLELCPPRSPSPGYLLSSGSRKYSRGPGGPPSDELAER
jgi:hypothetical protein